MKPIKFKLNYLVLFILLLSPVYLYAKGAGSSGGLSLNVPTSVRAVAFGEAYVAAENDITAIGYNPASLGTLRQKQGSFLYQKGLIDDAFGRLSFGSPLNKGGMGLSIGYYNAGTIEVQNGSSVSEVNAQRDITAVLGYAKNFSGVSFGLAGKYLSSELAEQVTAHAYALDAGLQVPFSHRFKMGAAIQNFGTPLKYSQESDPLQRIARVGFSYSLRFKTPVQLFLDTPYYLNEKELRTALGVETIIGPLALRSGLKRNGNGMEFSVGTGFVFGTTVLDYSFGLIKDLSAEHLMSVTMKFGSAVTPPLFVTQKYIQQIDQKVDKDKKNKKQIAKTLANPKNNSTVVELNRRTLGSLENSPNVMRKNTRRIYQVKAGETLGIIAKRELGNAQLWKDIYMVNKHLIDDPSKLEPGQKIILP